MFCAQPIVNFSFFGEVARNIHPQVAIFEAKELIPMSKGMKGDECTTDPYVVLLLFTDLNKAVFFWSLLKNQEAETQSKIERHGGS